MTLAARDMTVRRGGVAVARDVSLTLRPGELTMIVGPNGAGKSSLLGALAGLLPIEGSVALDGVELAVMPGRERARAIGLLPQQAEAAWDISVQTLVGLGRLPWRAVPGRPARAAQAANRAAVAQAMAVMELDDLATRPVTQLSGGEQARAAMARVLAGEPRWILADEPLASLDLAHQQRLLAQLRAEADGGPNGQGRGVVVVVHDLATAMNRADRVAVLDNGRVVADGAPDVALSEATVRAVWQVEARWTGGPGERALIVAP